MISRAPRIIRILERNPCGSILIFERYHVWIKSSGQIEGPLTQLVITPKYTKELINQAIWEMWGHEQKMAERFKLLKHFNQRKMAYLIQNTLNHHIIDHRIAQATRRVSFWYTGVETYNLLAVADKDTIERILKDDLYAAAVQLAGRGKPDTDALLDPWSILECNNLNREHVDQLMSLPCFLREGMWNRDYGLIRHILDSLHHYPWIRNISKEYARMFLSRIYEEDDPATAAASIERVHISDVFNFFYASGLISKNEQQVKKEVEKTKAVTEALLKTPHQPLSREFRDLKNRTRILWKLTDHDNLTPKEMVDTIIRPEATAQKFGLTLGEWNRVMTTMTKMVDIYCRQKERFIIPKGPEMGTSLLRLIKKYGARQVQKALNARVRSSDLSFEEDLLRFIEIWCRAQSAGFETRNIGEKASLLAQIRGLSDMDQAVTLLRHPHPKLSYEAFVWPTCKLDIEKQWSLPKVRPGQKCLTGYVPELHDRVDVSQSHETFLKLKTFTSKLKRITALEDKGLTTRSITHDGSACIIHDRERIHAVLKKHFASPCLTISLQRHQTHLSVTGGELNTPLSEIVSAIDSITPEHALPREDVDRAIAISTILTAMMSQKRKAKPTDFIDHPAIKTLHEAHIVLTVGDNQLFVGDSCALATCEDHIMHEADNMRTLSTTALLQAMHQHMDMEDDRNRALISERLA